MVRTYKYTLKDRKQKFVVQGLVEISNSLGA